MAYRPKPESCVGCPAYFAGKSFVPPTGTNDAKLVLVSQGPNQDEAIDGKPFAGSSEYKLNSWLTRVIARHKCAIGNIVWCWLPEKRAKGGYSVKAREPTKAEQNFCWEAHVKPWLESLTDPKVIVAVGSYPAKVLQHKASGVVVKSPWAQYGTTTAHPEYITQGNWPEEPLQVEYLKHAREIADGYEPQLDPAALIPTDFVASPTLADLDRWKARLTGAGVAIDIETAGDHLRLVGLIDCGSLAYLAFPVRSLGGGQYWGPDDLPRAVEWLWSFLADDTIEKFFHNGQAFDVPVLERNGFLVRGYAFDTLLGMHIAHTGVPKDLETLAGLYLRMPPWKDMVKGELEGEGK